MAGWAWLVQVVTGWLLLVLVAIHLVAQHFVVPGGLRTYQDVRAYVSHPLIWSLEALFLVVVTVHAALGLRAIALDFAPAPRWQRRLDGALGLLGFGTIAYGLWLLWQLRLP